MQAVEKDGAVVRRRYFLPAGDRSKTAAVQEDLYGLPHQEPGRRKRAAGASAVSAQRRQGPPAMGESLPGRADLAEQAVCDRPRHAEACIAHVPGSRDEGSRGQVRRWRPAEGTRPASPRGTRPRTRHAAAASPTASPNPSSARPSRTTRLGNPLKGRTVSLPSAEACGGADPDPVSRRADFSEFGLDLIIRMTIIRNWRAIRSPRERPDEGETS